MSRGFTNFAAIFDLEQLELNLFRAAAPQAGWEAVYGGQVIAQTLLAASRTVEGAAPHSLHAYFILPGDVSIPIIYEVDRIRDGRSFVTRRVSAIQRGKVIYATIVSFQREEAGFDYQVTMPRVVAPDDLPEAVVMREKFAGPLPYYVKRFYGPRNPVELRSTNFAQVLSEPIAGSASVWLKFKQRLPDDPNIHRSALAFASDMTLLDIALARAGQGVAGIELLAASLDHALWFHRPFRADEWLLYHEDNPNVSGGRGLGRGLIFTQSGTLVASVVQEGLIRVPRPAP